MDTLTKLRTVQAMAVENGWDWLARLAAEKIDQWYQHRPITIREGVSE
jgi:hypothetical protein